MALDYGSVKDMYDTLYDSGVTTQSLPEWSQEMNELTGTELYTAGLHDNWIKRASHGIDKLLERTGLPGYGEELGRSVGGLVGAPEAGAEVGHGLPRSVLNFAPLLIPGGGIPGVIAKYGATAALTGAEAYEKTDSPLSALIAAGTATALPGIAGKTSETVGRLLSKSIGVPSVFGPIADVEGNIIKNISQYFPETFAQRAIPKIGGEIAGQVAGAGAVGVSQPLEQLARGEEPTSPFTVENLLGLTLGQAPFAAIHLGRQAFGPKPPMLKVDELQNAIKVSQERIAQKEAKQNIEDQTGVEQIPTVVQPPTEEINPVTVEATSALLSRVRGEQVAVKDNPLLTEEQKYHEENLLSQQDYDLMRKREAVEPGPTVLGDKITPEVPRQEVFGQQLYINKTGTFRRIRVADDPLNPENLRGKIIGYSTTGEPAPYNERGTGVFRYSLPPPQWHTVDTAEEYMAKFPPRQPIGVGTPELPIRAEPITQEELSAKLHELESVHTDTDAANTPGDLQRTVVKLGAAEADSDFHPTNDASLRPKTEQLEKAGIDPNEATKIAVKAQATRVARQVQASAKSQREVEREVPALTPEEAGRAAAIMGEVPGEVQRGFSVITADKLSHAADEPTIDTQPLKDVVTDTAVEAAASPRAKQMFDVWPGHEDTTYAKDFADFLDLTQKYGSLSRVPPEEAGKYLAERTGVVPMDAEEMQEFLNRPHVQEWGRETDKKLADQQARNEGPVSAPVPPPVINVAGRKGSLLKNERVNRVVEDFSKGAEVTDAFGGSGQLAQFAKGAGATGVTLNIREPQMRGVFDEIKHNTEDFAARVAKAVEPIVSTRDISVPTVKGGGSIKDYLNRLEEVDPNVALFVKQNLNARGREVTETAFTPTKVISSTGLMELPNRIRDFAGQIDKVTGEDGWNIVANAKVGDKITVDPPYVGEGGKYADTPKITTEQRLGDYEKHLYPAAERGAKFVVFDVADPQLVQSLQNHGFTVEEVARTSRGGTVQPELVAHNAPEAVTVPEPTRAPGTAGRADAPIWLPQEQRDIDTIKRVGLDRGGAGMIDFLSASKNPFFPALAKDLAPFTDSLARTIGSVRDMDGGAYLKRLPGGKYEVALSPAILRSDDFTLEYAIAHELVHGLTLSELDKPTNVATYNEINALRERVINQLPKDMRTAFDAAVASNWYSRWGNREVTMESLMPNGTAQQRDTLYSLLSNAEFTSQGLSSNNFRNYLRSVKSQGQTLFNKFTNLVRAMLRLGDKVSGTAFEEFLSHTSNLLDRGNYVASFKNFSDRYFENLGMSQQYVSSNTQRAMALMLSDHFTTDPMSALTLLRMGAGGVRSPEWLKAQGDVTKMFNERGEDATNTQSILSEVGHTPGHTGLLDLADSLMLGEEGTDVLDVLPEAAARYVLETAKDAQNILGAINAATREGNKGILNIANPEFIRGTAQETLAGVNRVVEASRLHDMQIKDIQGMFAVTPDGFLDKIVSAPEALPPEFSAEKEEVKRDMVSRFLEPTAQIARRIPESAEVLDRGYQLKANVRHMAREALKALGMDLDTQQLTPKTVKNMFRAFSNTTVRRAADRWIAENNIEAGRNEKGVTVIDVDDPRIQKIVGGLSPGDRDIVEDMVNKHSISTQQFQDQVLEVGMKISSTKGGALVQKLTGGKFKDSQELASRLLKAFTVDRTDPNAAAAADNEIRFVQERMQPDQFLTVAKFTEAAANHWKEQKAQFDQNPGWSTARRFGKYLIEFKKNGKVILDAVDSQKEAKARAEGRPYKLTPNRQYDEDRPPSLGFDAPGVAARLRQYDQNMRDILQNTGTFEPEQIELMKKYASSEQFITEEAYRGGLPNLQPQPRKLGKGAEELPWLRNHVSWIHQSSNYWSRQLLRTQAQAHLMDPEIAANPQLRTDLQKHFENMLQPDTQFGRFMQRFATTWFMGANPASAMMNATQPFMTHVAEFTAMTGKPLQSYRRVLSALGEIVSSGFGHKEWKDPVTADFMKRFIRDGEADQSMFDDEAAGNELLHTNLVRMLNGDKPQTLGQKLGTVAGNMSNASMMLFRTVERINAMIAGIASYKYYLKSEPNLGLDGAYTKAVQFHHAVNFGGGAAARPIGAFGGRGAFPRTTAMISTAMQSYNLGTTFQLARYIRQGFFRPAGLTPAEVHASRTAAVQMLSTQLAAAGVLGLPFVSGMLAVLNQAFPDLELNRKLRENMHALFGGDDDNGNLLADIGMTGVPSMMGWDMQSRLSMGNTVPGVSEINGFQPEQVLGAPANLITSFVRGGFKLAAGEVRGVDDFMPSALKKSEQLLRSGGQVLDYRDRPIFTPTFGEKVGIALGFNPKRLSDFNAASRIAKQTDDNIKRREGEFHQQMAEQVLQGNFGSVRQALQQKTREDKGYDPQAAVRSIASAAEGLTFPRDLRREGIAAGGDIRSKLLATFNLPQTGPSEVDRLNFRTQVGQRLGLPATSPMGLQTAAVMDELRRQNPEASRAELRQQATLLLHGRRQRTLALPTE